MRNSSEHSKTVRSWERSEQFGAVSSSFGDGRVNAGAFMSEEQFDFEKLNVYQRALEYVDFVCKTTRLFPKAEFFQFRRAATSICLNIAEGSGGTKAEFNQYLKIARRSTRECIAISEVAYRQAYLDQEKRKQSRQLCTEISKMLSGLMKSL